MQIPVNFCTQIVIILCLNDSNFRAPFYSNKCLTLDKLFLIIKNIHAVNHTNLLFYFSSYRCPYLSWPYYTQKIKTRSNHNWAIVTLLQTPHEATTLEQLLPISRLRFHIAFDLSYYIHTLHLFNSLPNTFSLPSHAKFTRILTHANFN